MITFKLILIRIYQKSSFAGTYFHVHVFVNNLVFMYKIWFCFHSIFSNEVILIRPTSLLNTALKGWSKTNGQVPCVACSIECSWSCAAHIWKPEMKTWDLEKFKRIQKKHFHWAAIKKKFYLTIWNKERAEKTNKKGLKMESDQINTTLYFLPFFEKLMLPRGTDKSLNFSVGCPTASQTHTILF